MSEPNAQSLEGLIERVKAATGPDNGLDIEIDIALFVPDARYLSVKPNSANTKLVFTLSDGRTETYWARDHTLNETAKAEAVWALTSLQDQKNER